MALTGKGAKAKGAQFERDLAAYFTEKLGIDVFRSLYDGDPMARKGKGNCDLIGTPDLAVEAKRTESLSFPEAMRQAIRNAGKHEVPVVINRRSRQKLEESYVLLRLEDFTEYYKVWCVKEGYCKNTPA